MLIQLASIRAWKSSIRCLEMAFTSTECERPRRLLSNPCQVALFGIQEDLKASGFTAAIRVDCLRSTALRPLSSNQHEVQSCCRVIGMRRAGLCSRKPPSFSCRKSTFSPSSFVSILLVLFV